MIVYSSMACSCPRSVWLSCPLLLSLSCATSDDPVRELSQPSQVQAATPMPRPGRTLESVSDEFELARRHVQPDRAEWYEAIRDAYGNPGQSGYDVYSSPAHPNVALVGLDSGSGLPIVRWFVLRKQSADSEWKLVYESKKPMGYALDLRAYIVQERQTTRVETRSIELDRDRKTEIERVDVLASWKEGSQP